MCGARRPAPQPRSTSTAPGRGAMGTSSPRDLAIQWSIASGPWGCHQASFRSSYCSGSLRGRRDRDLFVTDWSIGTVDGYFERSTNLTHPLVAETPEAFHENGSRGTFDRVKVDRGPPRNRIITGFEHHLARQPADRRGTWGDQSAAEPWNRGVTRQHHDGTSTNLRKLAPPHLASSGNRHHEAAAASRNEARSPH